jgi:hypothetical protein
MFPGKQDFACIFKAFCIFPEIMCRIWEESLRIAVVKVSILTEIVIFPMLAEVSIL